MSRIPLGELTAEAFLAEYWQKKPLLIRQAFPDFVSPLEPDELAGLACRPDVLSRLIQEKGGDYPWQARQGPFEKKDFDALGDSHWTLLVQEVDRHVPAVADLFDQFDFVPHWRKDDVMVSFAANDAGVGPHIDSYDVFLLQGSGRRRWEIAPAGPNWEDREGLDIKMLSNFEPTETYELEPGDMLYLPPGVPHNGVALEPCLTFSFGFLAPSRAEVLRDFADWYEAKYGVIRYADHDLFSDDQPGLIDTSDINRLLRLIREAPLETEAVAEWFGAFITQPQRGPIDIVSFEGSFEDFSHDFAASGLWRRHEGVRIAGWVGEHPHLFVDGKVWEEELPKKLIETITGQRSFTFEQAKGDEALLKLLYAFTEQGYGYFPDPEGDAEDEEDADPEFDGFDDEDPDDDPDDDFREDDEE
jgi:50S ribosomal protein L16 3-hydroxylase